jgi:DNA modification methylase
LADIEVRSEKEMKLSQIKKNPANPRVIRDEKFEKLKNSIKSFPQMMSLRPIVVDESGTILGGNMRYEAIKALKMAEIPDEWVKRAEDLTEEEKKEFIVKDNVGFGEWDWDSIANEWDDLPLSDWGLDVPGFEMVKDETTDNDAEPQIDRAEELNKVWQVKSGDLWQIGEHRLLCGSSADESDVLRLMGNNKACLMWTDPPYGVSYVGKTKNALTIENDDAEGLEGLLNAAFSNADKVLAGGAAIYVAHPAGGLSVTFGVCFLAAGWRLHQTIIWVKDSMVLGHSDYHFRHEPIKFGYKKGEGRFGRGGSGWHGDHSQTSILEFDRPKRSEEHPTMKPVELVAYCVKNSSPQGGLLFEPFAGSGTTLVASQNLNRKCYAIEISENYCAVILERMKTAFPDLEIKRIEQSKTV